MATIQKERENFYRACNIILDLCAQAQRDVLEYYVPATRCPTTITGHKLNPSQQTTFRQIQTNIPKSYGACDVSLLYILLRNIIPGYCKFKPTRGWGKNPRPLDQKCADDVAERVRVHRNTLVCHNSTTQITDTVYNSLVAEMQDVMNRLDGGYGGTIATTHQGTYLNSFKKLCTDPLEPRMEAELLVLKAALAKGLQDADGRLTVLEAQVQKHASDITSLSSKVDDLALSEEDKDALMKGILEKPLEELSDKWKRRLISSMSDTPDLWFFLLVDFGFPQEAVLDVEHKSSGSKNPVRKFVDIFMNDEALTIDLMANALCENQMIDANETLQQIRGESMYFKDLAPHQYEKLYKHFYGRGGFHLVDGWQDLLTAIGLSRHIEYIKSLGLGKYICEKSAFDLLIDKGITLGEFHKKVLDVDQRRDIPQNDVDSVRDTLDEVLKDLSDLALDSKKIVQKCKLTLHFSYEALRNRYGWIPLPSFLQYPILTRKDCLKDSPLYEMIESTITDSFDQFMENNCQPFKANRCQIRFEKPDLVTTGNYLLFKLILNKTDGAPIPEIYHSYNTAEAKALWKVLKSAIYKASLFTDCDVHIGLEEWQVNSIDITVSLTKVVKCLWTEEEVAAIVQSTQAYIDQTDLPDDMTLSTVVPDMYLKYDCEIMVFDEDVADVLPMLLYDFEESLVGYTVNGSPGMSGTDLHKDFRKNFSEQSSQWMDIDNVSLRQTGAVATEDENVQVPHPEGISHMCTDESGQLIVLVHDEQNVREFLFQDKISYEKIKIDLPIGGNSYITTYQHWLEVCQLRYGRKDRKIKLLEESDIILRTPDSWKRKLADLLRKLFDDRIFMTDGYEITEYSSFLGYIPSEISCPYYQSYSAVFKHFEHILVFLPAARVMLLMLVVNVDKKKTPYLALNQGFSSLPCAAKRYIEIHHKYFREGEISLITSIVVPGMQSSEVDSLNTRTTKEEKKDSECCATCKDKFILCESHLNDQDEFQKWWDKLYEEREKIISSKTMDAEDVHEELVVQMKGFIDTRAIWTADKSIISRRILLDELQKKVLSEGPLKVVIHGAYGSGKTFLLQLRLKQLTQCLKNNDTIFFLTYNRQSLLLQCMKDYVESLPKETLKATVHAMDFKELANHFDIPDITLTKFFEQISKSPGNHAIIDELSPIDIPRDEIGTINNILTSPNLEHSSIWIALVPVARTRKIGKDVLVQEEDTEVFAGMKQVTLDTTFRCSDEIHKLVETTIEIIENHPSKFPYSQIGKAPLGKGNKELNEIKNQSTKDQEEKKKTVQPHSVDSGSFIENENIEQDKKNKDSNDQESNIQSTGDQIEKKEGEQNQKYPVTEHSVGEVMDKVMKNTCGRNKEKSKVYLDTSFKFLKSASSNVSEIKSLLISPFPDHQCADMKSFEKIFRVYIALETLKLSSGQIAIICTNLLEYQVSVQALALGRKLDEGKCKYDIISYLPTLQEDQYGKNLQANDIYKMLSKLSNYVLITDINGVTGLEFRKVIIPVTPSEEFESYALVSSIARCQSELILLQFPWFETTDNPITAKVIEAWKESKVVVHRIIEFEEFCECIDDSLEAPYHIHAKTSEDKVERISVHAHKKIYDYYEEIKDLYILDPLDAAPEHVQKRLAWHEILTGIIQQTRSRHSTATLIHEDSDQWTEDDQSETMASSSKRVKMMTTPTTVSTFGPAGIPNNIRESGANILDTFCNSYPDTETHILLPNVFAGNITELMEPRENLPELAVFNLFVRLIQQKNISPTLLIFRTFEIDTKNQMNFKRLALRSLLPNINFKKVNTEAENDFVVLVQNVGVVCIEAKCSVKDSMVRSAEKQLTNVNEIVQRIMKAMTKDSKRIIPTVKLIIVPNCTEETPIDPTQKGSFFVFGDKCENFEDKWVEVVSKLNLIKSENPFTPEEYKELCQILVGLWSAKAVSVTHPGARTNELKQEETDFSIVRQLEEIDKIVDTSNIRNENQFKSQEDKLKPFTTIVRTNQSDIFRSCNSLKLLYLTPAQQQLFSHQKQTIVRSPAGCGKSLLILFKTLELVNDSKLSCQILILAPVPHTIRIKTVLQSNNISVEVIKEFPPPTTSSKVFIMDVVKFFKVERTTLMSYDMRGYHLFIDDLQQLNFYDNEQYGDTSFFDVGDFIDQTYRKSVEVDRYLWVMMDAVQGGLRYVGVADGVWPQDLFLTCDNEPRTYNIPTVSLLHVMRNTYQIIKLTNEARHKYISERNASSLNLPSPQSGHKFTSHTPVAHKLEKSTDMKHVALFIVTRLREVLHAITSPPYSLPLSNVAVLHDSETDFKSYKDDIVSFLINEFNTTPQTIKQQLTNNNTIDIIMDEMENTMSFEIPAVVFVSFDNRSRNYYFIGTRARVFLNIIDICSSETPEEYNNIDLVLWRTDGSGGFTKIV